MHTEKYTHIQKDTGLAHTFAYTHTHTCVLIHTLSPTYSHLHLYTHSHTLKRLLKHRKTVLSLKLRLQVKEEDLGEIS